MCEKLQRDLKISVIIPAYNCEKTLDEAMKSLLNQNYENIEIVLVDDGSTDGTKNVIKTYIKTDNRIHAVFQKNSGPSAARNSGLKIATGNLIMFMDADDKMESNVLSYLVHQIQKNKCDLLITGMRRQYKSVKGKLCENSLQPALNIYRSSKEIWKELIPILKSGFLNSVWAKVYRKEIIDLYSIEMDNRLDMGEDLQFNLDYLEHCESLLTIPYTSYIYLMQNSYLTGKYRNNMFQNRKISIELLRKHLEMHELSINIIYFLYLKLMIAENMQAHEHGIKYKLRKENLLKCYMDRDIIRAISEYQPEGVLGRLILGVVKTKVFLIVDLFSFVCIKLKRLSSIGFERISV